MTRVLRSVAAVAVLLFIGGCLEEEGADATSLAGQVPIAQGKDYSPEDIRIMRTAAAVIFDGCPDLRAAYDDFEAPTLSLTRMGDDAWGDAALRRYGWIAYASLQYGAGDSEGTGREHVTLGQGAPGGEPGGLIAKGPVAQAACGLPVTDAEQRSGPLDVTFMAPE